MSVPLPTSEVVYVGNGVTVDFPIPYTFAEDADIDVMLLLDGEDDATAQVDGVDYNLEGASNAIDGEGGTCTMAVAPPANATLTISRTVPITQAINLRTSGPFSPATHMLMMDKLCHVDQQLDRRISALEGLDQIAALGTIEVNVLETNFTTDADVVEDTFPLVVALPVGVVPTVVVKAKCVNEDDGAALFQEAVAVENWSVSAGNLSIGYVTGLAPGVEYTLRLLLLSIEVA